MSSGPAVYLLHFERPLAHARLYVGVALDGDVQRRLAEHLAGRGSPLVRAVVAAGIGVDLVLSVPGDRGPERRWHNRHGHGAALCRAAARNVHRDHVNPACRHPSARPQPSGRAHSPHLEAPPMTSDYFSVRELLGLDPRDRLGECSRCGEYQPDAVQLRVIGHQVAAVRGVSPAAGRTGYVSDPVIGRARRVPRVVQSVIKRSRTEHRRQVSSLSS